MGSSSKLVDLLKSNLGSVKEPANYQKLRHRLSASKPKRQAPAIKESPENAIDIEGLVTGHFKANKPLA